MFSNENQKRGGSGGRGYGLELGKEKEGNQNQMYYVRKISILNKRIKKLQIEKQQTKKPFWNLLIDQ